MLAQVAEARLGEAIAQSDARYGTPLADETTRIMETQSPILKGGITRTYDYQGWSIRVGFLPDNGPAVRIEYRRKMDAFGNRQEIAEAEAQTILQAESGPNLVWTSLRPEPPISGNLAWRRSDNATALLLNYKKWLRVELPASVQFEQDQQRKSDQDRQKKLPPF